MRRAALPGCLLRIIPHSIRVSHFVGFEMGKKRKFTGNQHTGSLKKAKLDVRTAPQPSRSAQKLEGAIYNAAFQSAAGRPEGYRLIDVSLLAAFLYDNVVCPGCHGKLVLSEKEKRRQGWASNIVLTCERCHHP